MFEAWGWLLIHVPSNIEPNNHQKIHHETILAMDCVWFWICYQCLLIWGVRKVWEAEVAQRLLNNPSNIKQKSRSAMQYSCSIFIDFDSIIYQI